MAGDTATAARAEGSTGGRIDRRAIVAIPPPLTAIRQAFDRLLTLLLLTLLSGLPQVGMSMTGVEFTGERVTPVPLTQSLLLEKLPPEDSFLTPPRDSGFPPFLRALATPEPVPVQHLRTTADLTLSSSAWFSRLCRQLYRHNSNYV